MEPRISLITLGVADLARATRFYADCLGLPQLETPPSITFFELGTTWLALWSPESLAEDAGLAPEGSGFRGFALAHNVRSPAEVDALLTRVAACGGTVTRPGHPTDWGATPDISPIPKVLSGKSHTTRASRMSEPILNGHCAATRALCDQDSCWPQKAWSAVPIHRHPHSGSGCAAR